MATVRPIALPSWLSQTPTPIAFSAAFSSTIYRVRIKWDNRALPARVMKAGQPEQTGIWRIDLLDMTGTTPILLGRKLVLTDDLWGLFHYKTAVPPGALRVRRTDGATQDPGLYDLGGAVVIEYVI